MNRTMKILLSISALVIMSAIGGYVTFYNVGGLDNLSQTTVKKILDRQRDDLFSDGEMHVFTLGTGTPLLGTGRMPPRECCDRR